MSRGYFEKHINRMRKFYKNRRNRVVSLLQNCKFADRLTILEQDAGLHFLLKVDTELSDEALTAALADMGIRVLPLSHYYHGHPGGHAHHLVVNYAGVNEELLERLLSGG